LPTVFQRHSIGETLSKKKDLLSTKFEKAFHFAHHFHRNQVRTGTKIPYISHVMTVSSIVLEYRGTENEAIAALLHDLIEDHGPRYSKGGKTGLAGEIKERFGQAVLDIVLECTDTTAWPAPPWRVRKEKYIENLKTSSKGGTLVSMADKIHNSQSIIKDHEIIGDEVWDKFEGKEVGTKWYYGEILKALNTNKKADPLLLARLKKEIRILRKL